MESGWIAGWKQIAKHLDRSVRTVHRYHDEYHMPIVRGPEGMPFALKTELDDWLRNFDKGQKNYASDKLA